MFAEQSNDRLLHGGLIRDELPFMLREVWPHYTAPELKIIRNVCIHSLKMKRWSVAHFLEYQTAKFKTVASVLVRKVLNGNLGFQQVLYFNVFCHGLIKSDGFHKAVLARSTQRYFWVSSLLPRWVFFLILFIYILIFCVFLLSSSCSSPPLLPSAALSHAAFDFHASLTFFMLDTYFQSNTETQ